MDLGLADRVYVLTGATKGLGFATARELVADGARVILSSRDHDRVTAAVAELGPRAAGIACDLGEETAATDLVEAARDHFGRFDGALISVGGPILGTAAEMTDDQWRSAFETVFLGTVRAARVFATALRPTGGAIALVLSTSVREPLAGLGLSNGLRPGLAGVAKDMATQYAPDGVRFVSLLPGSVLTDRARELFDAADDPSQAQANVAARVPLGRMGEPSEFGKVAAFVLSPAAAYVTGITLPVDGGSLRGL